MTDIIDRMQSAADLNPGASAVLDEAADEIDQLRARIAELERKSARSSERLELRNADLDDALKRIAELEGDKDRATDLNRMLKRNNGALISQKTAVEHVAKGYGWDEGSDHDQDALGFIIDRIEKLEDQLERAHMSLVPEGMVLVPLTELEAQRVPDEFADVMRAVFAEMDVRDGNRGNAPGHAHEVPGIWDDDNGELAGQPCAWCALWNKAKAMLSAAPAPSAPAEVEGEREAFTDAMWNAMESTLDSRGFRVGASDIDRDDYEAMWRAARAQLGAALTATGGRDVADHPIEPRSLPADAIMIDPYTLHGIRALAQAWCSGSDGADAETARHIVEMCTIALAGAEAPVLSAVFRLLEEGIEIHPGSPMHNRIRMALAATNAGLAAAQQEQEQQ